MSCGTGDRFGLKLCEDLSDACVVDKQHKQRKTERERDSSSADKGDIESNPKASVLRG